MCGTRPANRSYGRGVRPHPLAVAPGVILGYDRNVATNTMLRKHGIEVLECPAANLAAAAAAPAA